MRTPAITARDTLFARLKDPAQNSTEYSDAAANMPPYMESLLAHLRLLVGVPMEYLVPDDRLLPPESIRFFYLDRSWTDRLVDGALAVGQIGSREQAHYHAHAESVAKTLDQTERAVRRFQLGKDFAAERLVAQNNARPADVVTGFILRSSAVKQWPHMDVRAYDKVFSGAFPVADPAVTPHQLKTLRLEIIAPSVMIALFEREPAMVILEEPHHGVQFGVRLTGSGPKVPLRYPTGQEVAVDAQGHIVPSTPDAPEGKDVPIPVPTRYGHDDVVRIAALRDALEQKRNSDPKFGVAIDQTGSAALAISLLDPPWRQHFEGTEDMADSESPISSRVFVRIADTVREETLHENVTLLLGRG